MSDPASPFDAAAERERSIALAKLGIFDTPPDAEFDDIARLAAMVLDVESTAVTLLDDNRQWFKARHGIPFAETPREISFCIHAAAASEVLIVPDASKDERFSANPLVTCEGGIRFYAGFPLILASGHCAGTLCAFDPSPRFGLTEDQRALLIDLAKIATRLLESHAERRMGQIAARVVQTTADAVLCVNDEGLVTFWSRGAETMFGYGADVMLGRSFRKIVPQPPGDDGSGASVLSVFEALAGSTVELGAVGADGEEFPVELSLTRWRDGKPAGDFAAIVRDVSQRRQMERERRHEREFLDAIITNLPAMLFVKDAVTREYLLVNRAGENLIGLTADEIVGHTDKELFPEYGDGYERRDTEAFSAATPRSFESIFVRDDGTAVHLRTRRIVVDGPTRSRQYILGMSEDMTQVRKAEAEVMRLAHFDTVTGLLNRGNFMDRLERLIEAGVPIVLLGIDLDRFKTVNDQFGHLLGDEVLAQVGDRLRALVEPSDIVARVGGDEFAVILMTKNPELRAGSVAQAVVASLAQPFVTDRATAYIGGSVGMALAPDDATTLRELRHCVDLALYRAKAEGRGTVCTFSRDMDAQARDRQALEADLRAAMSANEIYLVYQPILAAENGQITSVEALARWAHPTRGQIGPDVFIPLAEECGFITQLGEQLLHRACTDALGWPSHIRVAVNLSPLQIQAGRLSATIREVLDQTGLPADRLQLEVTEGLVIRDVERTFIELERLRALGIQILMDDFGVGYSSLSYFERFRFDKVKIDKSFVSNLSPSQSSKAIIKAVIGLGRDLGMGIVAEGVETREQMEELVRLGCTHFQGFLFSEPLGASMIAGFSQTFPKAVGRSNAARRVRQSARYRLAHAASN
ncbi:sensor domain-containing phosphodiesterase [Sphingomonas abietis]|uniref:EAL domain-containing protein n=1 Tax=Sphingomonas abietis TaxID=3012344 RepID=A0ABY7NSS4_9SPHN|nr:EAL domain-containing protein [Sphingomonas abietis]WBO23850.1 EAL domain-containing protein [Sphingomonas abietis]